ncbi:hypothetical protein MMC26_003060 [Xylographa opegraphella]|nr:hypothetical protein [Xylographa opegraphella]
MAAFEYEELDEKLSEIRLVRLCLTDVFTDDIELELFRISLSDLNHEPYVPLSYTWGTPYLGLPPDWDDPKQTRTVSLNGKSFQIRLNLESALRHIRGVKKNDVPLWIDAICIDQMNIPERNSQVLLMRQIYEGGSYTIIWLGPAQEGSKLALYKIEEVANARRERFFDLLAKDRMAGLVSIIEAVGTDSQCWLAIRQVLSCCWWSRAWVFQEAVVSSHAVLLCGFDAASICDVMETLMLMSDMATEQADNASYITGNVIINQAWVLENAMSLLSLWRAYGDTSHDAPAVDLRDALFFIRRLDATNARDKIYAALGLVKGGSAIVPDYSLSVGEVYRSFARQYIEEHNTLDLLEECSLTADDIVSWAPNYSRKIYGHTLEKNGERDGSVRLYNASRGKPAKFSFSDDSKTLTLVGCYPDTIAAAGTKWEFVNPRNVVDAMYKKQFLASGRSPSEINVTLGPTLAHWKELIVTYGREWDRGNLDLSYESLTQIRYLHANDDLKSAFDKTLCADVKWISNPDPMKSAQHVRLSTGENVAFEPINWETGEMKKEFKFAMKERIFFITRGGYIGLAPEAAEEGDVVCVVLGGQVPYLIRPKKNGHYLFVGECYVHGLMDGQALQGYDEGSLEEIILD